jgi:hypothetical protein
MDLMLKEPILDNDNLVAPKHGIACHTRILIPDGISAMSRSFLWVVCFLG